jgi:acetyltransferase-like isoleucine patch superfamily enzyme
VLGENHGKPNSAGLMADLYSKDTSTNTMEQLRELQEQTRSERLKGSAFEEGWNAPWKVWNHLHSWLILPWVRLMFAFKGISWGADWRFYGVPIIQKHRESQMCFGSGLRLRSTLRSNPLGPNHPVILATWKAGACLEIGAGFAMTGGSICAEEHICIGDQVVVGANTTIVDTDFHPLEAHRRFISPAEAETSPVVIENQVFIGMNCLILKGVRIGEGSMIGAGSVVTSDLPAGVIAAGNPARILRWISPSNR